MAKAKKNLRKLHVPGTLVLVGAGKMGSALLAGWLGMGLDPRKIAVIEPKPAKELLALKRRGLRINPSAKIAGAAVIVLAIKPQTAPETLPSLIPLLGVKTVV